LVDNVVEIDI